MKKRLLAVAAILGWPGISVAAQAQGGPPLEKFGEELSHARIRIMKRLRLHLINLCAAAIPIVCASAGMAQATPLHSVEAIHALSNAQASPGLPVAFEATVTYYKKGDMDLFVQDGATAVYAETSKSTNVSVGDRVLVVGRTRASFRPEIKAESVTVVGRGVLPTPVPATFKQLVHGDLDSRRVTVRARVRGMNTIATDGVSFVYLQLLMEGGSIDAQVAEGGATKLGNLLDAEVEITGAVAGKFDSKVQLAGILLEVPFASDVRVLQRAPLSPASLPVTAMDEILGATNVQDRTERVRVSGTITYYQAGSALVLQEGSKSLWVKTLYEEPLRLGDRASASGFPGVENGSIVLNEGEIEASGVSSRILPLAVTARELTDGSRALELVSIEGRLLMSLRQSAQDEYVIVSGRHLFSAIYRHPQRTLETRLPAMKQVPAGSQVRVSGICILDQDDQFQGPQAFSILLRSSDDVALVAGPPLLNVRNLILLACILLTALVLIGARGWAIERRLRHKTAELASIEQGRGEILEDINGSKPLADILGKIVQNVSFKLDGAACWCVLADGMRAGNRPVSLDGRRVIDYPIASRPGAQLGRISVAVGSSTEIAGLDEKVLTTAVGLAFLAIETDRLHSDLRHRSEFDLLTDIHNRFSLERRLDQLVESARSGSFSFGLIYIDLDRFKAINDTYGHNTGDLYLRETVSRMNRQIRPGDMLARIGGDEFAVLIVRIASADTVKEVAVRLEHCFEAPF
ncbi:MAG TPA: GGDEF domain-containing protein, partial [Candidatus Sulfopaludibacter sp.]|nr:GGDEF domain-containing protein [Candidatus Sulfopaludibacter sp.]